MQFLEVGGGLLGRAQIRLGNDFQKWRAGAVEVDIAHRLAVVMDQLAGILFHMDAGDTDGLWLLPIHLDLDAAMLTDRQLELGDLVALGQVRVKIILAGKAVFPVDGRIGGQAELDGRFHHLPVEHRQRAGHTQADRAGMGVGRRTELGGTAAENLAFGLHLGMDFQPDHGFKFHSSVRFGENYP